MLAEGEDAESDKLEFGVCGCVGLLAQGGGEAQEIMAGTAGGFGNLEKDLVDKGSGEVGEGEGGDGGVAKKPVVVAKRVVKPVGKVDDSIKRQTTRLARK